MAKKVLINNITAGSTRYLAGAEFDTVSDATQIALIAGAGGVLLAKEIPAVAAAQALAASLRLRGGAPDEEALAQIFDAALQSASAVQSVSGAMVLGVLTINTGITVTAATRALPVLRTPGGTMGARFKTVLTVGGPGTGAVVVTATDAAGATVATDTSTYDVILLG